MKMKELCWLLTTHCNENCGYCSKFTHLPVITNAEYKRILEILEQYGTKHITFGGGEPFLTERFDDIVRMAKQKGIHLKVVTNGDYLLEHGEILPLLDEITLSLDSVDRQVNEKLGRGADHYSHIQQVLTYFKENRVEANININTVATRYNLDYIQAMIPFIKRAKIHAWRILRFSPLRGRAARNKAEFAISDNDFEQLKMDLKSQDVGCPYRLVDYDGMSQNYLLIAPDGNVYVPDDLKDVKVGHILEADLKQYFC